MPFDTIEKIRRRIKNIIDHEKFETVLTEEMEKLPSDFHLKIVYSGKTYSLYTLIPALKKGEIP